MALQNKYRILVWVSIILVATNLSMGISYWYHNKQERNTEIPAEEETIEVPAQQRTRFFREQLNLTYDQVAVFRQLNRDFNRTAWQIQHRLSDIRMEMVNELGREQPDRQKLDEISARIGELHQQLKQETISYYLAMRETCTEEQQEKLHDLFIAILKNNEDVRLPQPGRGMGRRRQLLQ